MAVNKFLDFKLMVILFRAFCVSLIDYAIVNIEYSDGQKLKIDAIMYKTLKHMMKMKTTTLSMNPRVVFDLPKYNDRKRITTLIF